MVGGWLREVSNGYQNQNRNLIERWRVKRHGHSIASNGQTRTLIS